MTKNIRRDDMKKEDLALMAEECNCSVFSMAALAGGLLLCVGIVLYALFCA